MNKATQKTHSIKKPLKAFVCGWPIEHSRSPLIHNYWLSELGIEGSYEKIAVSPNDFHDFLTRLRELGFVGGNITIPHKQVALRIVDKLEDAAVSIGAVNTVWYEDNQLVGGNTDWLGFLENLDENASGWSNESKTAVVIGAGGAARSVLYALLQRNFENIILANRTMATAEKLALEFSSRISACPLEDVVNAYPSASLLVNTSSMGMENAQEFPGYILEGISRMRPEALVTDIVYSPLNTPLLEAAQKAGLKTVDGLGMLLHQAVPGFEKWFGVKPEVTDTLRKTVLSGESKGSSR